MSDLFAWKEKPDGRIDAALAKDLAQCALALEDHLEALEEAINIAFAEDNKEVQGNFFVDFHAVLKIHVRTLNDTGKEIKKKNCDLIGVPEDVFNVLVFGEVRLREGFSYRDLV